MWRRFCERGLIRTRQGTTTAPAESGEAREAIRAAQIDALFRAAPLAVGAAVAASVVLLAILRRLGSVDAGIGSAWSVFIVICALSQIALGRAYWRSRSLSDQWRKWALWFTVISFAERMGWGWAPIGLGERHLPESHRAPDQPAHARFHRGVRGLGVRDESLVQADRGVENSYSGHGPRLAKAKGHRRTGTRDRRRGEPSEIVLPRGGESRSAPAHPCAQHVCRGSAWRCDGAGGAPDHPADRSVDRGDGRPLFGASRHFKARRGSRRRRETGSSHRLGARAPLPGPPGGSKGQGRLPRLEAMQRDRLDRPGADRAGPAQPRVECGALHGSRADRDRRSAPGRDGRGAGDRHWARHSARRTEACVSRILSTRQSSPRFNQGTRTWPCDRPAIDLSP